MENVQDSCDELWMCEDADEVLGRLQVLRRILPNARPDSYDPSEAFLAIQGAALRFLPAQTNDVDNLEQQQKKDGTVPVADDRNDHSLPKNQHDPGENPTNIPEEPKKASSTPLVDDKRELMNWSITEESLNVAVDLACSCIGPAWRSQIFRRQQLLARQGSGVVPGDYYHPRDDHSLTSTQSEWAPPSEVMQVGTFRSFSPVTATINIEVNNNNNNNYNNVNNINVDPATDAVDDNNTTISFPPIPEVLPAAMLRFAASVLSFFPDLDRSEITDTPSVKRVWDTRIKNVATAQRLLVLGICCDGSQRTGQREKVGVQQQYISTTDTAIIRWTIPGANELVGNMLLFWLRFAFPLDRSSDRDSTFDASDSERVRFIIDWLHILGVTRAATDLVSTGWRPLPQTDVGPIVVRYLLEIAQSGISLLDPTSSLNGLSAISNAEIRKEVVIALSSAAESISALASLASRGLIPDESQKLTTRTICHIHVVSGLIKGSFMGVFPVGANQNNRSIQQLPTVSDNETFLSQIESCFADTADFLWILLGTKSSSANSISALIDIFNAANPKSEECTLFASAGWDTRKKLICMSGGTALRMTFAALWERHPSGFNTSHLSEYMGGAIFAIRSLIASVHSKVHDTLVAAREDEVVSYASATDLLSLALDTVVALGHFVDRQLAGDGDLTSVVGWEQIFLAIQDAYVPWDEYKIFVMGKGGPASGLQSIIEQAYLERDSLLLRVGAFLDRCVRIEGSPFHSFVEFEVQKSLYVFILRTVAPRMDPVDSKLLGLTAFRAWVKFVFSRCIGWAEGCIEILSEAFAVYEDSEYVHSPQVRAETLRLLTLDAENFESDKAAQVSMVTMSRDVGGIHERVIPCLITILYSVLSDSSGMSESPNRTVDGDFRPLIMPHSGYQTDEPSSNESSYLLESYGVKLAGRLVREVSTIARNRSRLIELLRAVALDSRWPGLDAIDAEITEDRMKCSIRLAATIELGRCFVVPFGSFPMLHEIIPQIVEALSGIVVEYARFEDPTDDTNTRERASLVLAGLSPFCRLRLCSDGKTLCLLPSAKLSQFAPPLLGSLLSPSGQDNNRVLFAPLIEVDGVNRPRESGAKSNIASKKTVLSLDPIISAVIQGFAAAEQLIETARHETFALIQSISALCLHSLTSFILSGIPLHKNPKFEDVVTASGLKADDRDDRIREERTKTLRILSESAFARLSNESLTNNFEDTNRDVSNRTASALFRNLLPFCNTTSLANAFIAVIPSAVENKSLKFDGETVPGAVFSRTVQMLSKELRASEVNENSEPKALNIQVVGSLLAIVHELLSTVGNDIPETLLLDAFHACKETVQRTSSQSDNHAVFMAIRCFTTIVDRLQLNTVVMLYSRCPKKLEDVHVEKSATSFGLTTEFIRELECELLSNRFYISNKENRETQMNGTEDEPNGHEALALEIERIEKFVTEKDVLSEVPVKASWLCGRSVLLSFRVGSSSSRYRGWVEIILRSPTFRTRAMVRLLSKFSIRNPDLPNMLWSTENEPNPVVGPDEAPLDAATQAILGDYQSLISRFDSLFPPDNPDENDSQLDPSVPDAGLLAQTDTASVVSSFTGRAVEADNVSVVSNQNTINSTIAEKDPRTEALQAERSMETWLGDVLGDQHSLSDVLVALSSLNVSVDAQKNDDTTDRPEPLIPTHRLRGGSKLDRAIAMLDRIIPMNTHKVGLLYAGPKRIGANDSELESALLSTPYGSPKYHNFAEGLGDMIPTKQLRYFSAGLDVSKYEADGHYARVWVGNDGLTLSAAKSVVVYHAVHLMPQGLNNRKRHIGNDNVLIVFVDNDSPLADDINISAHDMKETVVSGHFGFVTIFVLALPQSGLARVSVCLKDELPTELHSELHNLVGDDIIAMHLAPAFVRSLAIRADLACRSVLHSLPPPCNCFERYQILCGMKRHVVK